MINTQAVDKKLVLKQAQAGHQNPLIARLQNRLSLFMILNASKPRILMMHT